MYFLQNWTAGFSLDLELCEVGSWICLSFFSWCSTEVCRYTSHHCGSDCTIFVLARYISKKTFNHADFVSWKIFQPIRDLIYMIVRLHVVSLRKWASWWKVLGEGVASDSGHKWILKNGFQTLWPHTHLIDWILCFSFICSWLSTAVLV